MTYRELRIDHALNASYINKIKASEAASFSEIKRATVIYLK